MNKADITLKQVKASYTANKREDARKDPWAHYVARPLSFPIAYWLMRCGVTVPVKVVFAGMSIGLAGLMCFASGGGYWWMLAGAILININGLLDYVDGDIARTLDKVDEYGGRIDGLNYLIITGLLFACIGSGLDTPWMIVGAWASFLRMLRFAVTYQANIPSVSGKPNIFFSIGMAIIGAREPILLACAVLGRLEIFLLFYLIINYLELVAVLNSTLKK